MDQYSNPDGMEAMDLRDYENIGVDMNDFVGGGDVEDLEDTKHLDPALQATPLQQTSNPHAHAQTHPQTQHQHHQHVHASGSGMTNPNLTHGNGNGQGQQTVNVDNMFHTETGLDDDDDDDDGNETPDTSNKRARSQNDQPGGFTYVDKDGEPGRRKIRIEYISDKSRRHITFSKRKAGIMKKAYELSILTGTQVLLLVVSETGLVYTFTTTKLQPLVQKPEGKNLIQACLNAPEGFGPDGQPLTGPVAATKAKNGGLAIRPHKLTAAASAAMAASAQAASNAQAEEHHHSEMNQLGLGTPGSRPKKRLPSGKGKKAQSGEMQSQPDHIPPVPQIPDMHRGQSPQHNTPTMMALQSPYGHLPAEHYGHGQHNASPSSANFYSHSPGQHHQAPPQGGGDYGGYYGGHPHAGYMMHQQQQQQQQHQQGMQYEDTRQRMMMEGGRNLGMGYVPPGGHNGQGDV